MRILLCFFLLMAAWQLPAAEYWVAGSFANQTNAEQQRIRLSVSTGLTFEIYESDGLFRLVVEKSPEANSAIVAAGITPWRLETDDDLINAGSLAKVASSNLGSADAAVSAAATPSTSAAKIEDMPAPVTVNPPVKTEDLLVYCTQKANKLEREIYCQDPTLANLFKASVKQNRD